MADNKHKHVTIWDKQLKSQVTVKKFSPRKLLLWYSYLVKWVPVNSCTS